MGIPGGFGSTLIGGLVSAMLYGITTLQTYVYYMHYSDDASTMKFIVAVIWILDTMHVSFMCHVLYYYLITNYGVPTSLEYIVWSFPASILVNTFVIAIVQFFFAHKIYYLCRRRLRWWVITPIILLVLVYIGFSIATNVVILLNNALSFDFHTRFYTSTPSASAVVLAEIVITVSLCVLLHHGGLHSAAPRTKRLLSTLVIYAVNRCLLTLLITIAEVAVVADADHTSSWPMAFDFVVGKLYANSLLGSLNTRQHLRSQDSGPVSDLHMNVMHFANPLTLSRDIECSMNGIGRFHECKVAATDITTEPGSSKTMITMLRREAETEA